MLFNSVDFAIFLPIVFTIFWLFQKKGVGVQNLILLTASYIFYGRWDWRFLSLIILSSIVDFYLAKKIHASDHQPDRKRLLWCSVLVNLGMLGFFKYYNFFLDNFVDAFKFFGSEINPDRLAVIIPVGISFYTFQTLSYTIDVYRGKLTPTNNFISFAAFVSFFPQLVAGPIERATNLLPQFDSIKKFNYNKAVDGCRQILWGFFKKMVIADNCAEYVNIIFAQSNELSGLILVIGAALFAFQIYCDFSGYSDIAIGLAKLFGFDLKQNFAFPYFSRNVGEFWRRWHMSLSTWFRDYLYIPLGGSKNKAIRNLFIVFIVSGFWHGANWTFIMWGALNALLILPSFVLKKNRKFLNTVAEGKLLPSIPELGMMILTFLLITVTWVFFRAENLQHAIQYFSHIVQWDMHAIIFIPPTINVFEYGMTFLFISIMLIIEWFKRTELHGLVLTNGKLYNWVFYLFIATAIFIYAGDSSDFIYFQF